MGRKEIHKKKIKKLKLINIFWYLITFLILFGSAYILLNNETGYLRLHKLRQEKEKLASEVRTLHNDNEKLKVECENLQKDNTYIEKYAREKLEMVKEDEICYKLISTEKPLSPK